jgi:peptidoglycan/xylan/chitin deacetylase (PgdA/CDA1 family)
MSFAAILMYHNIAPKPPPPARLRWLHVDPGHFRFQMRYLKFAGFQVVSLKKILEFLATNKTDSKLVALTFDDAYLDFYENAYPVLREFGYPATVYAVSDRVGKFNQWDSDELKVQKKLMDWNQLGEMSRAGIEIGSHTRTHPFLAKTTLPEAQSEILDSRKMIEDKLGKPVHHFCYPYGSFTPDVRDLVATSGYLSSVTVDRGSLRPGDDPYQLRRFMIKSQTLSFIYRMHSDYENRRGSPRPTPFP